MKQLKSCWLFTKGFIILNVLWYVLAIFMNSRIVPFPHEVYANIPKLFSENLSAHIIASLYRIVIGLISSVIIGSLIGVLMGYFDSFNKLFNPLVYFTYPIPKTALLPVVMTIYGLEDGSKIIIVILITIFPIIVSVRDSVIEISRSNYDILKSLGASKLQLIKYVTIPAILPRILSNIRFALGTAFSILFFVEAYGTSYGIGYFIQDAWSRINYIEMYSGIAVLSILGLSSFIIIDVIEDIVCRWKN